MAVLGLHHCEPAFCGCGEQGLLAVMDPLVEHRLEHAGFSSCVVGSAVAPGGLQSTVPTGNGLSHSAACGALPDQGLDECPLPWQVDSYPLYHQGSLLSLVNSLWGTCNLFPKPIQVALLDKV